MLLDQTGSATFGLGLFIDFPRGGASVDLADDHPLADDHLQAVDRAVFGQGIEIGGFDPVATGVSECLDHLHPRNQAGDGHVHVRAQLHRGRCRPVPGPQQKGAGGDLVVRRELSRMGE
ncbi:hypothetical protein D3C85_622850 [compost metagenome]